MTRERWSMRSARAPSARALQRDRGPAAVYAGRVPPDDEVRRLRRRALLRVGLAAALLAAIFAVVRLTGLSPSAKRLEHWADGLGVFGPIIFIAAGVALNCVFVPIPVLAGAAGLVFGTAEGTAEAIVAISIGVVMAVIGALLARGQIAAERRRTSA